MQNVSGQVVLITGGAGGVGVHLARNFGKLNAKVVIWDVNTEGNYLISEVIDRFTKCIQKNQQQNQRNKIQQNRPTNINHITFVYMRFIWCALSSFTLSLCANTIQTEDFLLRYFCMVRYTTRKPSRYSFFSRYHLIPI